MYCDIPASKVPEISGWLLFDLPWRELNIVPEEKESQFRSFLWNFVASLIFVALENTVAHLVVSSTLHSGSEINFLHKVLFVCLFV